MEPTVTFIEEGGYKYQIETYPNGYQAKLLVSDVPADFVQPPTEQEVIQAAALLNQAEIIANQRQQDKVMAAILLEQVGGEANV